MGHIYMVTHRASGRRYVGMTVSTVSTRWANHVSNSKRGMGHLARQIQADGKNAFDVEALEEVADDALCDRERWWIGHLGTIHPYGFNANAGGAVGPRGYRRDSSVTSAIAKQQGVSRATACRWVAEGRYIGRTRQYRVKGEYKTPAWVKWHEMKGSGGRCGAWDDFYVFQAFYTGFLIPGRQFRRRDKTRPWGPDNCYMPELTLPRVAKGR